MGIVVRELKGVRTGLLIPFLIAGLGLCLGQHIFQPPKYRVGAGVGVIKGNCVTRSQSARDEPASALPTFDAVAYRLLDETGKGLPFQQSLFGRLQQFSIDAQGGGFHRARLT